MSKQRFEFMFDDIEPKLLRKGKDLKKKNKYSLKQAEMLVSWIQQNWSTPTSVTLMCHDTEEGKTYAFDGISIVPFANGGKEVALFHEMESQILQAPDNMISDPNSLIMDIENQYSNELDIPEPAKSQPAKKGFKLPSMQLPFGKKKELIATEESDQYYAEYESESTPPVEEREEQVEDVVEEVEDPQDSEESFEFEDNEYEEQLTTSSRNDSMYENSSSLLVEQQLPEDNRNNLLLTQQLSTLLQEQQMNVRPLKKHESVQLVTLKEYCEIGEEIEQSIVQMTEKLKPENLFRFIGILSAGLTNTRIDEYRSNHAMLRLAEAKFENLREHYSRQVNGFKAEALEYLKTAIDIAWKNPYDLQVKKENSELLAEMETKAEEKISEFVSRQEEMLVEKTEKFKADQEIELQRFKEQQQATLNVYISQEQERIQNLIDSKAETINSELEKEREEFLDEEIYKLKNNMNLDLFDGKRVAKQNLAVAVAEANEDVWNTALKFIEEIQNEIEEKTPLWASQIKEFNILEQQEHDRNKQQEEIKLRKESLEIKRLETEINLKRQTELEHENKMLAIKLETALSKNELYEIESKNNQSNDYSPKKTSPFNLLTANRK